MVAGSNLAHFLTTVPWPGAAIVIAAIVAVPATLAVLGKWG